MEKLKEEHSSAISQLIEVHAAEISKLKEDHSAKLSLLMEEHDLALVEERTICFNEALFEAADEIGAVKDWIFRVVTSSALRVLVFLVSISSSTR